MQARPLALLALVAACSHDGGSGGTGPTQYSEPDAPATVAQFTVLPVIMPDSATVTPLGHIQPVGHVLPTDHVYFYPTNIDHRFRATRPRDRCTRPAKAWSSGNF
jgi:hypothetical protein